MLYTFDKLESNFWEVFEEKLNKRQQYVLIKRFGLDREQPRSQQWIADLFGCSRQNIRRIEKRGLRLLKFYITKRIIAAKPSPE